MLRAFSIDFDVEYKLS
uniref:Uncharacterized protein n=1 Tax=Anguilla anguilla TaxID=7936 RepID=A0A0E9TYC3_ANGAN